MAITELERQAIIKPEQKVVRSGISIEITVTPPVRWAEPLRRGMHGKVFRAREVQVNGKSSFRVNGNDFRAQLQGQDPKLYQQLLMSEPQLAVVPEMTFPPDCLRVIDR